MVSGASLSRPELDSGPLFLEAEERHRVLLAPAAPHRLLQLLLGQCRDHHGHVILPAELGGQPHVLAQEPEREVHIVIGTREHGVGNHVLEHAPLTERALGQRVEQHLGSDAGLDPERHTLGVKAGVAPEVLLDALSKSSFGQGRVLKDMIPNTVFPGAYDNVNFALRLLRKDVGLATELGREYHVPLMIAALAEQQLEEAMRRGWGEKDSMTFFRLQEERAGVELRTGKRGT